MVIALHSIAHQGELMEAALGKLIVHRPIRGIRVSLLRIPGRIGRGRRGVENNAVLFPLVRDIDEGVGSGERLEPHGFTDGRVLDFIGVTRATDEQEGTDERDGLHGTSSKVAFMNWSWSKRNSPS